MPGSAAEPKHATIAFLAASQGLGLGCLRPWRIRLSTSASARYAHKNATDEENRQHLKNELEKLELNQSKAYFVCVLVLVRDSVDPFPLIATGLFEGVIKTTMRGKNGFGYDPMFYPKNSNFSLAEMNENEKALLSHRGIAIQILKTKIERFFI